MNNQTKETSAAAFYDALAPDYDEMTGFQKRFEQERPSFRVLVGRFGIQTALDVGCGTGFHSALLAQLGVAVTAIDISPAMLRRAMNHAQELKLSIDFLESSIQNLTKSTSKKFNAVFVMGNTLAHLLTDEELQSALLGIASVLLPGGVLILQNLNYDRILSQSERIQGIKESSDKTFIRSYDYRPERIAFNIQIVEKKGEEITQKNQTVLLRPYRHSELVQFLLPSGFSDIESYGSISLEEFEPAKSKDLVIIARKNGHSQG
jgi:SAM-dependent methyltransferase